MAFTDFNELNGSPVLDFSIDRQSATREGKVGWSNLNSLISEVFPPGGIQSAAYPDFPVMRARRLHIEPFSGKNEKTTAPLSSDLDIESVNVYADAKVRIEYEYSPNFNEESQDEGEGGPSPDPVPLLRHRWSIGGEFLTIPATGFEWAVDNEKVDKSQIDIGIILPSIEHQITWPRVQFPPFNAIRNTIGKCNNNSSPTLNFKTGTILPETLLFLGAELQRDILATGELAWEVSYRFSERRVKAGTDDGGVTGDTTVGGWNHFYRSDDEFQVNNPAVGFFRIEGDPAYTGGVTDIYEKKDFLPLFVQEGS